MTESTINHQGDILIVDDIPDNLTVLAQMLTEHGYRVRPALNGKLALSAIQKSPPDLILLDIVMPDMNGYEICWQLKANSRTRDIPVLFLSALDDTVDKLKAFDVGGVDYITKPFQVEEVLARVQTHLALRNMQKRLENQNVRLQREISERQRMEEQIKASLKERELLLQELYRRTENSMQIICSMLKLQSSSIRDKEVLRMFDDLEARINVMALVHQKLSQTENISSINLKGFIYDLGVQLSRNYKVNPNQIALKAKLESVSVAIDTAILCGLLLNELLSNCLKHAFPAGKTGEIRLGLRVTETGGIELRVADNGIGLPKGFDVERDGLFGLQLIRSIEESQLRGSVTFKTDRGTEWIIRFKEPG